MRGERAEIKGFDCGEPSKVGLCGDEPKAPAQGGQLNCQLMCDSSKLDT